jgi:hypothetical protein
MAPRTAPKERDPHSERVIFDMAEWHDRLERLADRRRGIACPGRRRQTGDIGQPNLTASDP